MGRRRTSRATRPTSTETKQSRVRLMVTYLLQRHRHKLDNIIPKPCSQDTQTSHRFPLRWSHKSTLAGAQHKYFLNTISTELGSNETFHEKHKQNTLTGTQTISKHSQITSSARKQTCNKRKFSQASLRENFHCNFSIECTQQTFYVFQPPLDTKKGWPFGDDSFPFFY